MPVCGADWVVEFYRRGYGHGRYYWRFCDGGRGDVSGGVRGGATMGQKMVLIGIVVSAMLSSVNDYLITRVIWRRRRQRRPGSTVR